MIARNVGAACGRPSQRGMQRAATGRPYKKGPMKKRFFALLAALSLLLTGCSGLLERDYTSVTPHNAAPATEGDPSILRADSYQELVNALIYFVNGGMEEGVVRLYTDAENVEPFLSDACLEVVQEDPLGAYCVEFIKYTVDPVVAYSEAHLDITYRRTREQVASIVQATGVTAIRSELESALSSFAPSRTLRIRYFEEDEAFIRDLARQAYYAVPACALGMPEIDLSLYPNSGQQRIVEILLRYPLEHAELEARRDVLSLRLEELAAPLSSLREKLPAAARAVLEAGEYDPQGGTTAYDLLEDGAACSEGLALAFAALCRELDISCQVAWGELNGEPRFWNIVQTEAGWRHLDLPESGELPYTDQQLLELGYLWDMSAFPSCTQT